MAIQDNLMKEVGTLQYNYQKLIDNHMLSKKNICDLVIPFRDKYHLVDIQALQIARNELPILSIVDVIERMGKEVE